MLGSDILDVAIGLVFMFFIVSLMLASAREMLESWLQTRAVHLERGLRELLRDETGAAAVKQLYDHPLIGALFRGRYDPDTQLTVRTLKRNDPWKRLAFRSNLPAYIPKRNFALALLDIAARGSLDARDPFDGAPMLTQRIRAGVADSPLDPHIKRLILIALDDARGDLDRARENIVKVFDSVMDRVAGWYRKETQKILFVMGLMLAVALNVDTINVARTLYNDEAVRAAVVAEAQAVVDRSKRGDDTGLKLLDCPTRDGAAICAQRRLEALAYPIGWPGADWSRTEQASFPYVGFTFHHKNELGWTSVAGWLLTALALSLGAPFWFDVLNKFMVIRSTVKPHEKSPEEDSEDRQFPSRKSEPPPPAPPPPAPAPTVAAPGTPGGAAPVGTAEDDPEFVPHSWADDPGNPNGGAL